MHKKYIAPIVISVILILYFLFYLLIGLIIPVPVYVKIILAVIGLSPIGVTIFVLRERILEIKSGDEDDLSKY